jgi:chromosome segregation ATPase
MEREVFERLERVSASINAKNEKLRVMKKSIEENDLIIKELQEELKTVEEVGRLDYEIAKERAGIEEYDIRNRNLQQAIEALDAETLSTKQKYELRIKDTEEIISSCEKGQSLIKAHCQNLQERIHEAEEESLLAAEDVSSAIWAGSLLRNATSKKTVRSLTLMINLYCLSHIY